MTAVAAAESRGSERSVDQHPSWRRRISMAALLAGLLVMAGCTRKEMQGDLAIWRYETWVGATVIAVGIGVTIGALLFRKKGAGAWFVAVLAVLFTFALGPFPFVDYVAVDKEHIATRWGFWFAPTLHNIRFDDVARIDYTKEVRRGRRGRKETSYHLVFTMKNGSEDKLTATNELMESASEDLLNALTAKDLSINDTTGE